MPICRMQMLVVVIDDGVVVVVVDDVQIDEENQCVSNSQNRKMAMYLCHPTYPSNLQGVLGDHWVPKATQKTQI